MCLKLDVTGKNSIRLIHTFVINYYQSRNFLYVLAQYVSCLAHSRNISVQTSNCVETYKIRNKLRKDLEEAMLQSSIRDIIFIKNVYGTSTEMI